jgi:predicted nuclease of predicted toxin-antitoxin system
MRLLLDESLPRGLKSFLVGHDVSTVQEMGWAGTSNGKLLQLAQAEFEVFITADQNLQYQQNLAGFDIAVLILAATSTRIPDLEPLILKTLGALSELTSGEVRRVAL